MEHLDDPVILFKGEDDTQRDEPLLKIIIYIDTQFLSIKRFTRFYIFKNVKSVSGSFFENDPNIEKAISSK